jgi:biotin carboxylase
MAFLGKKLLILGGNPETVPLVQTANNMGIITIVTDDNPRAMAKKYSHKSYNIDGLDVDGLIQLAKDEKVDGVLVGVADILVGSYYQVCESLGFPCYANEQIVDVFTQKDRFKSTCEQYGINGIPEYKLDVTMRQEDVKKIRYPVMVKPVDNGGGVGMTVCYEESQLNKAIEKAISHSNRKKFIVEKYMSCDDMGIYYTFKDGVCSAAMVYDRYTTDEQPGLSKVCLGGTYPSKFIGEYFENMHENACRMFGDIGIKNGVLMLSAFYEKGDFYVYDTGFRLQGEAPHLLIENVNGYDQREMLIRFALTGSMGKGEILGMDDPYLKGKVAATFWLLLKEGQVGKIKGLKDVQKAIPCVIEVVPRLDEGDVVTKEMVGNEKQVLARLYLVCETKDQLRNALLQLREYIRVYDSNGRDMLLESFNVHTALS